MNTIATPKEITEFLQRFKKFGQFVFIYRKKNLDSLSQLGITIKQAKAIIMQLTYENYYKGPEKDRDRNDSNIWEFGVKIDNDEIYIKLSDNFSYGNAKCISFHRAEFELSYPYKKGGGLI